MTQSDQPLEMIKMSGPTEAEMIQEMLGNNGIEAMLQGKESAETLPATGNLDEVRIWVKPEQAAEARELVEAFFNPVSTSDLTEPGLDLGVKDGNDSTSS